MRDFPASVEFHEEGPREGFQVEPQIYPLADRAALINALAASGLKQIQVASFVSPRAVPQMADTAELFATIAKRPRHPLHHPGHSRGKGLCCWLQSG